MASLPVGAVVMRFFASKPGKYHMTGAKKIMNIADKVKMDFENATNTAIQDWERDTLEPTSLFSRNRKLDKATMIKALCLIANA